MVCNKGRQAPQEGWEGELEVMAGSAAVERRPHKRWGYRTFIYEGEIIICLSARLPQQVSAHPLTLVYMNFQSMPAATGSTLGTFLNTCAFDGVFERASDPTASVQNPNVGPTRN